MTRLIQSLLSLVVVVDFVQAIDSYEELPRGFSSLSLYIGLVSSSLVFRCQINLQFFQLVVYFVKASLFYYPLSHLT